MTIASSTRLIFDAIIGSAATYYLATNDNLFCNNSDSCAVNNLLGIALILAALINFLSIPLDSFYLWLGTADYAKNYSGTIWAQIVTIGSLIPNVIFAIPVTIIGLILSLGSIRVTIAGEDARVLLLNVIVAIPMYMTYALMAS